MSHHDYSVFTSKPESLSFPDWLTHPGKDSVQNENGDTITFKNSSSLFKEESIVDGDLICHITHVFKKTIETPNPNKTIHKSITEHKTVTQNLKLGFGKSTLLFLLRSGLKRKKNWTLEKKTHYLHDRIGAMAFLMLEKPKTPDSLLFGPILALKLALSKQWNPKRTLFETESALSKEALFLYAEVLTQEGVPTNKICDMALAIVAPKKSKKDSTKQNVVT